MLAHSGTFLSSILSLSHSRLGLSCVMSEEKTLEAVESEVLSADKSQRDSEKQVLVKTQKVGKPANAIWNVTSRHSIGNKQ